MPRFSIFFVQLLLHSDLEFSQEVWDVVILLNWNAYEGFFCHTYTLARDAFFQHASCELPQVIYEHFMTVPDAMFTLFQVCHLASLFSDVMTMSPCAVPDIG